MPSTTRRTLRLPADLDARCTDQADREGMSLNAWIIKRLTVAVDHSEPAALDQRDEMENLARAWQDHDRRLANLERLARQAGADL